MFNGSSTQDLDDLINYLRKISESEVKEALKRMSQENLLAQMEFLLRYEDA